MSRHCTGPHQLADPPRPKTRRRTCARFSASLLALLGLVGCNSGLLGILEATDEDSSATNSPSTISSLAVSASEESPASIRFRVVDADGDAARVTLFYQLDDGLPVELSELGGELNPGTYAGSGIGEEHELSWDFSLEPGLPADGSFTDGVLVFAQLPGVNQILPGANAALVGLGNDPPTVMGIEAPHDEVDGIVPVSVTLADTSSDAISVRVEYELGSEPGVWRLARPGGLAETPDLAITGLNAPPEGVTVTFFWDSDADLPALERDVVLRFTPIDPRVEGEPVASDSFRVDNNVRPILVLDNGLVTLDATDRTGGIAIPFTVLDEEGDDVRVVFQWRRPSGPFPSLPDDPGQVFAIQADPVRRAEYQVCSERVSYFEGTPDPVGPAQVRLPGLGTDVVQVETSRLVGSRLEIVRPPARAVVVSDAWPGNPLVGPVGVSPLGGVGQALVLDQPTAGAWRLAQVDLALGTVTPFATGTGLPTALALDPLGTFAFVASREAATWTLTRYRLDTLELAGSASGNFSATDGVRGVAALSAAVAVVSCDDELIRVSFSAGAAPIVRTIVSDLSIPWGVVRDPRAPSEVLVAEHGADRVVRVDLNRGHVRDVLPPANPAATHRTLRFPSPTSITLERGGSRLVVVTEDLGGQRELRVLNQDASSDPDGDAVDTPLVYVASHLSGSARPGLGSARGERLLADPDTNRVLAFGGVEQVRTITSAVPTSQVVTVEQPFAPPLEDGRRWRIERSPERFPAPPSGAQHHFPWDSRDLESGGAVLFRGVPFDTEFGFPSETRLTRDVDSSLVGRRRVVDDNADSGVAVPVVADVDLDGDLDLVVAEEDELRVYLQQGGGEFATAPVSVAVNRDGSLGVPPIFPDLDGDGFPELVHLNAGRNVEVFSGTGAFAFEPDPEILTVTTSTDPAPEIGVLQAADVDRNGTLDLVVGVPLPAPEPSAFHIFLQDPVRGFDSPIVVAGGAVNQDPVTFALGDIDGDGLTDLAGGWTGSGSRLELHFQEAGGGFEPAPVVMAPGLVGVRDVALADLDGDGDLDVLVATGRETGSGPGVSLPRYNRSAAIFWQTEARQFDSEPLELVGSEKGSASASVEHVYAADLDDDGDLDVATHTTEGVNVFFARAGGFDPVPAFLEHMDGAAVFGVQGAQKQQRVPPFDLDGDGDLDLVYRNRRTNGVEIRYQTGGGVEGFSSDPLVFDPPTLAGNTGACVADFDGDGDLDLATVNGGFSGNFTDNRANLFFQSAPRVFAPGSLSLGGLPELVAPPRVEGADMDQDGDRDLLVLSPGTNDVKVYLQEPAGRFESFVSLASAGVFVPSSFNWVGSFLVRDIDLDGALDVVMASNRWETVTGYRQDGPGTFTEAFVRRGSPEPADVTIPGGSRPRGIALADVDGDSRPDLVVAASGAGLESAPGRCFYFTGGDPGEFATDASVFLEAGAPSIVLEDDVDGDGIPDLVTLRNNGSPGIDVHLRRDDGTLDTISIAALPNSDLGLVSDFTPELLHLLDLDGDGDRDLVFASGGTAAGGGDVLLVEQLAPGVFDSARGLVSRTLAPATALVIEDVDGDGELDAILTNLAFTTAQTAILWGND